MVWHTQIIAKLNPWYGLAYGIIANPYPGYTIYICQSMPCVQFGNEIIANPYLAYSLATIYLRQTIPQIMQSRKNWVWFGCYTGTVSCLFYTRNKALSHKITKHKGMCKCAYVFG